MAWTSPRTWNVGVMATADLLNTHIRDNLLAQSTHPHTGAAGQGDDELSGVDIVQMDSIGAASVAGQLKRNGAALTWGASGFDVTNEDAAAGVASLRSLGTGALQGAVGSHGH